MAQTELLTCAGPVKAALLTLTMRDPRVWTQNLKSYTSQLLVLGSPCPCKVVDPKVVDPKLKIASVNDTVRASVNAPET
jgi:hypothetical protein